jgi:hypothetical protein
MDDAHIIKLLHQKLKNKNRVIDMKSINQSMRVPNRNRSSGLKGFNLGVLSEDKKVETKFVKKQKE